MKRNKPYSFFLLLVIALLKRVDDYIFLDRILKEAYSIVIVPRKNLAIVWTKSENLLRKAEKSKRLIKYVKAKGIYIVWLKLTLY